MEFCISTLRSIDWKFVLLILFVSEAFSDIKKLELHPEKAVYNFKEGENLYVACLSTDNEDKYGDIKWLNSDRQEIFSFKEGGRTYTEDVKTPKGKSLFIDRISSDDQGTYWCVTDFAGRQIEINITVSTIKGITWEDAPASQHLVEGRAGSIVCRVSANPPAIIDWFKDGSRFVADSALTRYRIEEDGIKISSAEQTDAGEYQCRAKVFQTGDYQKRLIKVEHEPDTMQAVEGNPISVECKAKGHPDPEYIWVDYNNADLSQKDGYIVNSQGTLTITNVRREHTGEYKCIAKNAAGLIEATTNLDVVVKPRIETFDNITIDEDDCKQIVCEATGHPAPQLTLRHESQTHPYIGGVQPNDDNLVFELEVKVDRSIGTLRICKSHRVHDGLVECRAFSDVGEASKNGHVTVNYAPIFNDAKETLWSWDTNIINLTCLAFSIPNATITWFRQNEEIASNEQSLRIHTIDSSQYGTYKCKAENRLGHSWREIELRKASKPGPVSQAIFDTVTATSVTFRIVPPQYDGGLPVQSYEVNFRPEGVPWEKSERKIWTIGVPYVLEGLEPRKMYFFRFAAWNRVGLGEWSKAISMTMPDISVPAKPRILNAPEEENIIQSPHPDRYELRWQVPADNGLPITAFVVTYARVINESRGKNAWHDAEPAITEDLKYPGQLLYVLEPLNPGSFYRIELAARNERGLGETSSLTIQTQPGENAISELSGNDDEQTLETGVLIGIVLLALLIGALFFVDILRCHQKKGLTYCIVSRMCRRRKAEFPNVEDGRGTEEGIKEKMIKNSETSVR